MRAQRTETIGIAKKVDESIDVAFTEVLRHLTKDQRTVTQLKALHQVLRYARSRHETSVAATHGQVDPATFISRFAGEYLSRPCDCALILLNADPETLAAAVRVMKHVYRSVAITPGRVGTQIDI